MSIRSTAFFTGSVVLPVVISFGKADLQLTGPTFAVNTVRIPFNTSALQLNGKTFGVALGTINYDNGFMIF